ncbi:ankyrin repeat-containing domain protein, partial [Coprinopsis sp. MPI-PUGE-AT-0042]
YAAGYGYVGIVELLLARPEIQVNLVNNEGCSALRLAAANGHEGVVKLLLAHPEIQVNLIDDQGFSALMKAAEWGHKSIARLLLDAPHTDGVIRSTEGGHTAMSLALAYGHMEIAQLLQDHEFQQAGSAPGLQDLDVETVVDIGPLSIEGTGEEELEVGSGDDSDDSGSYYDAEESL